MRRRVALSLAALLLFGCGSLAVAQAPKAASLTNADVIGLVKAGLPADVIAAKIKSSATAFDTSPAALEQLKSAGVPDAVIQAMVSAGAASPSAVPTPAPAASSAQAAPLILRDGTPVKLKLMENMSSADATTGDEVPFIAVDPVVVNGVTVIPKGANAIGTVTLAKHKGHLGHAGKLDINIDSVIMADGDKAMLRAIKDTQGGGHAGAMTGAIVATSIVFFPAAPLFLFMHGKDITIPEGTEITAFVNGDNTLNRAKFPATVSQR